MIQNANAIRHFQVAGNQALTAATNINNLLAGEVVLASGDGTVLNAASAALATEAYLVQGQGATLPPIWSPKIKKSGLISITGGPYIAPVQQIDYWGYDGVNATSEIDVISDNSYTVRVNMFDSMSFAEKSNAIIGYVATGTSPTQIDIADAIASMMIEHSRYLVKVPPITVERLSIVAPGGAALPSGNAAVVHGSQNVTSVAHVLTVGSYVRFGAAVTDIIYKVAGVLSANVFILDVPYQGVTNPTIVTAEVYTAVAVQAVAAGIKISVTDQPMSFPGVLGNDGEDYYFLTIQTSATGGGVTNLQTLYTVGGNNTHPVWASGDTRSIFTAEQNYLGNEGYLDNRNSWPHVTPRSNVSTTATGFSVINIVYNDSRNMVIETANQRKEIMLACQLSNAAPYVAPNTFGTNIIGGGAGIADVLASFGSATGFLAPSII